MTVELVCRTNRVPRGRKRVRRFLPRAGAKVSLLWDSFVLELWASPERGFQPAALRYLPGAGIAEVTLFPPLAEVSLKKKIPQSGQQSGPTSAADLSSVCFARLPHVLEHLAVVRYEDGSPRQPGSIFVRTLGVAWAVTAMDPDSGCRLPVVANSLDDALAALDLLLGAEDAPWEVDPYNKRRGQQTGGKKNS